MWIAAPAVKPIRTEREARVTRAPKRRTASAMLRTPTINAKVLAAIRKSGVPTAATPSSTGRTSIDTALTGPVARWRDEPHNEPTMRGDDRGVETVLRRQLGDRRVRD